MLTVGSVAFAPQLKFSEPPPPDRLNTQSNFGRVRSFVYVCTYFKCCKLDAIIMHVLITAVLD